MWIFFFILILTLTLHTRNCKSGYRRNWSRKKKRRKFRGKKRRRRQRRRLKKQEMRLLPRRREIALLLSLLAQMNPSPRWVLALRLQIVLRVLGKAQEV